MDEFARAAALMPHVRLGIRNLPSLTSGMVSGGLYVLLVEKAPTRFPLIAGSLSLALNDGRRCSIILSSAPKPFIQRLEAIDQLQLSAALITGQCQMLCAQDEFARKMFRFGTDRFVQELEHFDVVDDSYLIFDQADELLSMHDVSLARQQIEGLSQWLQQHRVTALFVFLRTAENIGTLNSLMDNLTGIVRLNSDSDGVHLNFDYWKSPEGTISTRGYDLHILENQLYEVFTKQITENPLLGQTTVLPPPNESPAFFYMDPDLGSLATQVTGEWHLVDTLVGMMHATRTRRGATIIFCYTQESNLRNLAEAVHTLRINLGNYVKIAVQEKNASLRYQNEALLLRLGVNLIIHRDVAVGRLPLLLESLAGQVFSREVDVDFDAALASVTPPDITGYQPPKRFAPEIEGLINRATTLDIPCALIVARPTLGQYTLDIMNSIQMSRAGDLMTADNEKCYFFLYACQQSVILTTLKRMLGQDTDALFQEINFYINRETIRPELSHLQHKIEVGEAFDLSGEIKKQEKVPEAPAPEFVQKNLEEKTPKQNLAFKIELKNKPQIHQEENKNNSKENASLYHHGNPQPTIYGKEETPKARRKISLN